MATHELIDAIKSGEDQTYRALLATGDHDALIVVCDSLLAAARTMSARIGWDIVPSPEERLGMFVGHMLSTLTTIDPFAPKVRIQIAVLCSSRRAFTRELDRLRRSVNADPQPAVTLEQIPAQPTCHDYELAVRELHEQIESILPTNRWVDLIVDTRVHGHDIATATRSTGATASAAYQGRLRAERHLRKHYSTAA